VGKTTITLLFTARKYVYRCRKDKFAILVDRKDKKAEGEVGKREHFPYGGAIYSVLFSTRSGSTLVDGQDIIGEPKEIVIGANYMPTRHLINIA
jgi:hypothetical protein